MKRQDNRNRYPFHADNGPTMYTGEHVAAMMRAREAREARERKERRKERAAMLAYNVAVIAMLLTFFAYLTR